MARIDRLAEPRRGEHILQLYADDAALVDAVSLFAGHGLGLQEAVVLVATPAHLVAFEKRLSSEGFAVEYLNRIGQLIQVDARALLSRFMLDGAIDETIFKTLVGGLIESATAAGRYPRVRVFGEMVDLIWRTNLEATVHLEQLWNEVLDTQPITLFCAYSVQGTGDATCRFPRRLEASHGYAIPA